MSPVDENIEMVNRYYAALECGDFDSMKGLHEPDIITWMSGRTVVSGMFESRDMLYEHMGKYVLERLESGGESYLKNAKILISDGCYVVGLFRGGLPTIDGGRYDQWYLQIFKIQSGRFVETVEFIDTVMVETALIQNQLCTPRQEAAVPFEIPDLEVSRGANARDESLSLAGVFVDALREKDWVGLSNAVDRDVVVQVIGNTPLSGRFRGVDSLMRIFAEGVDFVRIVCAQPGWICLFARSANLRYDQQYGVLLGSGGQRVQHVGVFLDTIEVERFLFSNYFVENPSAAVVPPFDVTRAFRER